MPKLAAAAHKDVPMPEVVKQTAQPAQPKIQVPLKPIPQPAETPKTPTPSATDSK
jgi:hypothetical protein